MPTTRPTSVLTPTQRQKQNSRADAQFYSQPRLVQHVDEHFRERLTDLYRERLEAGDEVLDLMSSWVSHLPDDMSFDRVVGHGMNEEELAANERLDRYFLQDLNATQALPLDDGAFDAVLCAVSVQYLQYPEQVFAELGRTLRPGGVAVVSFSNRMFAQKAIQAWRASSGRERLGLVERYLEAAGAFGAADRISESPLVPPTQRFLGGAPDPFYAVCARRSGR
jgi:SAM-dependent methyltransferase